MFQPLQGHYKEQGKGKAVPLQAWSGPEGSRKLRFPNFMTTAQEGGKEYEYSKFCWRLFRLLD